MEGARRIGGGSAPPVGIRHPQAISMKGRGRTLRKPPSAGSCSSPLSSCSRRSRSLPVRIPPFRSSWYLVVILVTAKLMGHLAVVLGQPAVLGELLAGVLLGNLSLVGVGADSTGSRPIPASICLPGSAWWCSCSRWGWSRRSGTSCAWGSPRSLWRCWASPRPSPSGGWSGPGSFPGNPGRPTPSSGPPCAPRASALRRASSRTSGNRGARRQGSSSGPRSWTTSSG